jgi:hypothetical protein
MPTPAELREASRQAREAATKETAPHLKQTLASHAFALAQLAEKLEREELLELDRYSVGESDPRLAGRGVTRPRI